MSLLFFNQCTVVYCTHCDVISVRRGGGGSGINKKLALLLVGVRQKPALLVTGVRNQAVDDRQ